jgi:hypothetical protein
MNFEKQTLGPATAQLLLEAELDVELEVALGPYFYTVEAISTCDVTEEVQRVMAAEDLINANYASTATYNNLEDIVQVGSCLLTT